MHNMVLWFFVHANQVREKLRHLFIKAIMSIMAAFSPSILAANDDIAAIGERIAEGAKSGGKSAIIVAQFVGGIFVIGGLIAAKNKKDNPQIKVSHIVASLAFGACLIVIPEVIRRTQKQLGLTPVGMD